VLAGLTAVPRADKERPDVNSITEDDPGSARPRQSPYQFGLASLFWLTLLVACILSINRTLGPPYGWLSAIPLGIVATLALRTRWRSMVGFGIGFAVLSLVGYFFIIGFKPSDPKFVKAMVTLGSFGGAVGASINAIVLKRWIIGSILLAASIIAFLAALVIPIPS
jgi:hypothetical protein